MSAHYRQPGVFTRDTTRTDVPQLPDATKYGEGPAWVDGGLEYNDGSKFVSAGLSSESAIRAKALYLSQNGGGVVQIGPYVVSITSTLPLYSNVIYRGSGWVAEKLVGHSLDTTKGTVIVPSGNFPAFSGNNIDEPYGASTEATANQVYSDSIWNCGVENLAVFGGTYGIQLGAFRAPGCFGGSFKNLHFRGQTVWGVWFENVSLSEFQNIWITKMADQSGVMGCWAMYASTQNYNQGNVHVENCFIQPKTTKFVRGAIFEARGAAQINDIGVYDFQVNQSGTATTATGVVGTTGSPDLVLPVGTDMDKFQVGCPITFTAVLGGGNTHQSYMIVYSDPATRTIRCANSKGGAAFNGTTSSAIAVKTYGFPCLEVIAPDGGQEVQPSTFVGLDLEGVATCNAWVQNARINLDINTVTKTQGTNLASTIVARGMKGGGFTVNDTATYDFDASSAGRFFARGAHDANSSTSTVNVQSSPPGLRFDLFRGKPGIALHTLKAETASLIGMEALGTNIRGFTYPIFSMGQRITTSSTATRTLTGDDSGVCVFTGTGPGTWTLPTLNTSLVTVQGTYAGIQYQIVNAGTGTLTLSTASSQLFNNIAAKTSISIPAGASVIIHAAPHATTPFWAWTANNGAT